MNILVIGRRNAARSLMLEALFNRLACGRVRVVSAGVSPAPVADAQTRALLQRKGHGLKGLHPKGLDTLTGQAPPALLITLSAAARASTLPLLRQNPPPISAHWPLEDPAKLGSVAAYDVAYAMLNARARAWMSLDFERLSREERQHHLRRIGEASLVM